MAFLRRSGRDNSSGKCIIPIIVFAIFHAIFIIVVLCVTAYAQSLLSSKCGERGKWQYNLPECQAVPKPKQCNGWVSGSGVCFQNDMDKYNHKGGWDRGVLLMDICLGLTVGYYLLLFISRIITLLVYNKKTEERDRWSCSNSSAISNHNCGIFFHITFFGLIALSLICVGIVYVVADSHHVVDPQRMKEAYTWISLFAGASMLMIVSLFYDCCVEEKICEGDCCCAI